MKKVYFLLTALFPLLSLAQPTITQGDLPTAGRTWINATDSTYSAAILAGGANVTWNYASLANLQQDSSTIVAAAGTPYSSYFPTSNLASSTFGGSGAWTYFTTNSSGWYVNGVYTSTILEVYNPPVLEAPVPFTYTNTSSHTARAEFDTVNTGIPFHYITTIISSQVADGWGTLILPSGTFSNTLRVKTTSVNIDSILYNPGTGFTLLSSSSSQSTTYNWLRHGSTDFDLLNIDADSAGTTATKSSYYLTDISASVTNLAPPTSSISIYPNPTSGVLNFRFVDNANKSAVLKIYDSIGRDIYSTDVTGLSVFTLPTDNLSNGIYYYSYLLDSGTYSGKFSVAH